jgi:hypothetical protein
VGAGHSGPMVDPGTADAGRDMASKTSVHTQDDQPRNLIIEARPGHSAVDVPESSWYLPTITYP